MSNPVNPGTPTTELFPVVDPIEAVERAEERQTLPPTEPDWELWYRFHPAACPHVPTLSGHCAWCGTCLDHATCRIMQELTTIHDAPMTYQPVGGLAFFRRHINPWVGRLLLLLR